MEPLATWQQAIRSVLTLPPTAAYAVPELREVLLEDVTHNRFLVVRTGWFNGQNFYAVIQDVELRDGYVWIHRNNTEHDLSEELTEAGIAAEKIVLATLAPEQRLAS
ncbi:element excision factor XisI family protein [Hymenobacter weizhouensis]|uniref:element excision factor XisI family protein n=1 Tax=Hymenobacter sp. YIM 151500-1 TaxID=2987689 RepID=UPI002226DAFB|nr:element excision factor XisI family protein [Hymenobacter sp. YIM 151500-1]UYZ64619.1 element excision factor XisI family protein [Hymenobacter sp. YIM 151500-1]